MLNRVGVLTNCENPYLFMTLGKPNRVCAWPCPCGSAGPSETAVSLLELWYLPTMKRASLCHSFFSRKFLSCVNVDLEIITIILMAHTLLGRRLLCLVEVALVNALCKTVGVRVGRNHVVAASKYQPAHAWWLSLLGWTRRRPGTGDSYNTAPYLKIEDMPPSPGFKMRSEHVYIVYNKNLPGRNCKYYTIYNNPLLCNYPLHRKDTHKFISFPTNPSSGSLRHYPLLDPFAGSRKHFHTAPTIHTIDPFSGSKKTLPFLSLYPPFFRINEIHSSLNLLQG